jgi:NTP pyrophosphatase (non-canonical NTP hydrolase)
MSDVLKEMWELILKFNNKHFPKWRSREPIYYSNALAGESGEVCNAVKKWHGGGTNLHLSHRDLEFKILEECADVFIYMVLLIETLDYSRIDFEQAFNDKLEELIDRMETQSLEETAND